MKRIILGTIVYATMIFLALVCIVYAESPACVSSGLKTADGLIATKASGYYNCLCGVTIIPAAADAYVVLYDNTSATGTALGKVSAKASTQSNTIGLGGQCIEVTKGIYADVDGAAAAYIVWYR